MLFFLELGTWRTALETIYTGKERRNTGRTCATEAVWYNLYRTDDVLPWKHSNSIVILKCLLIDKIYNESEDERDVKDNRRYENSRSSVY